MLKLATFTSPPGAETDHTMSIILLYICLKDFSVEGVKIFQGFVGVGH